jgi:hypothetical protein
VPLVVAAFGVLGSLAGVIAGVLITQRRSDQREDTARKHERERERERWEREDQARTFEHRREIYEAYYEAIKAMALRVEPYDPSDPVDPDAVIDPDWWQPSFALLNRLIIYGTPTVAEAAGAAYACIRSWGEKAPRGMSEANYRQMGNTCQQLENDLLHRIREDLQIPGGRLTVVR